MLIVGVSYLTAPALLHGLRLGSGATPDETAVVRLAPGRKDRTETIFVLESEGGRFLVAAAAAKVSENTWNSSTQGGRNSRDSVAARAREGEMAPNRWMQVRHPRGFSAEQFELFRASCRMFRAFVEAALAEWPLLTGEPPLRYEFFQPELSADRTIATLPLGGAETLRSRHAFEQWRSTLLWEWFPTEFIAELEEALVGSSNGVRLEGAWRRPRLRVPGWVSKDVVARMVEENTGP